MCLTASYLPYTRYVHVISEPEANWLCVYNVMDSVLSAGLVRSLPFSNSKMPRWLDNVCVVLFLLQYFDLHLQSIPACKHHRRAALLSLYPARLGDPAPVPPANASAVIKCSSPRFRRRPRFSDCQNCVAQLDSPVLGCHPTSALPCPHARISPFLHRAREQPTRVLYISTPYCTLYTCAAITRRSPPRVPMPSPNKAR